MSTTTIRGGMYNYSSIKIFIEIFVYIPRSVSLAYCGTAEKKDAKTDGKGRHTSV